MTWVLRDGHERPRQAAGGAQFVPARSRREGLRPEPILVMRRETEPPHRSRPSHESLSTDEYTLGRRKFARAAEPGNDELVHQSKAAIRQWKNEFK
jgi:hypothetical protein